MLSEKVKSRSNNFDFLRFLAASLVIVSHTFPLSGSKFEPYAWLTGHDTFGGLAVTTFFLMSGFLITKSWSDKPSVIVFFKKRVLRIMPALIVSVFFCALIIGPLVTKLSLKDYFSAPDTYNFIKNIFLYPIRFGLPGVFADNPYQYAVNGSIWSLPVEFFAYCLVAFLGIVGVISRRRLIVVLVLCLLFFEWRFLKRPGSGKFIIMHFLDAPTIKCLIFFFIGSAYYLYSDKISLDGKLAWLLLVLFAVSCRTDYVHMAAYLAIPYLVLYIAYADIPMLKNFGKYGDFSYGMYVYAFPVQQAIMHFYGGYLNKLTFFFFAFTVTLMLAVLSWHLFEKPSLKLKNVPVFGLKMPVILRKILAYNPAD